MTIWIYIVSAALALTKLADVVSTLQRIKHAGHESNPIARRLMFRLGTTTTIWLVFVLALIIIVVTGLGALRSGPALQAAFLVAGVAISIIQLAVAHSNWTRRDNLVTRMVRKAHVALKPMRRPP